MNFLKRREIDKKKIILAGFDIEESDEPSEFYITNFKGPKESLYEGGKWKLHIQLPENYPYKSPSIGFVNRIYHPNVDESSGTICLDVINQTWSPLFELKNIFEEFLPQLLLYPNAKDPLNANAADLMLHNLNNYEQKVKQYVKLYAKDDENIEKEDDKKEKEKEKLKLLNRKTSRNTHCCENESDFENDEKDSKDECEYDNYSIISSASLSQEELTFGKNNRKKFKKI